MFKSMIELELEIINVHRPFQSQIYRKFTGGWNGILNLRTRNGDIINHHMIGMVYTGIPVVILLYHLFTFVFSELVSDLFTIVKF